MSTVHLSTPSATTPAETVPQDTLGIRQVTILAAWGVLLWLLVALLIRAAPPTLFDRGAWTVLLFVAALPNAWLTVWLTRRLVALQPRQLVPGVAVSCAAAMLCDGIALTWTTLYGPEDKDLVPVAAFLLWGVALILLAAFAASRRAPDLR